MLQSLKLDQSHYFLAVSSEMSQIYCSSKFILAFLSQNVPVSVVQFVHLMQTYDDFSFYSITSFMLQALIYAHDFFQNSEIRISSLTRSARVCSLPHAVHWISRVHFISITSYTMITMLSHVAVAVAVIKEHQASYYANSGD